MEWRRREEEWQQRDRELRAQLDLLSKLAEAKSDHPTAKKRVESILDFQFICHLHSGTYC